MSESRGRMEARLKREGRWDSFEARRRALKAEGLSGSSAYQKSVAEFAPIPHDSSHDERNRVPAQMFAGKTAATQETVAWVAQNIALTDVKPENAPSSESWAMLQWVRGAEANEREFWERIFTKLLPPRPQMVTAERFKDDGRDLIALCDQIIVMQREAEFETALGDRELAKRLIAAGSDDLVAEAKEALERARAKQPDGER